MENNSNCSLPPTKSIPPPLEVPSSLSAKSSRQQGRRLLWLVRHGERADNVDPEWRQKGAQPRGHWDDPPLSARGAVQAAEVGQRLVDSGAQIHYLVCSPFSRCLQTAQQILKQMQLANIPSSATTTRVLIEPGICESLSVCQSPPGFPGAEEIHQTYPEMPIDHSYCPFLSPDELPKDERTNFCCFQRVIGTLKHIVNKLSGNLLVVTHGSPITAIHFALTGQLDYMGQCTISHYRIGAIHNNNNNKSGEREENKCLEADENVDGSINGNNSQNDQNSIESITRGKKHKRLHAVVDRSSLATKVEIVLTSKRPIIIRDLLLLLAPTTVAHSNGHQHQKQQQQQQQQQNHHLLALTELDENNGKGNNGERARRHTMPSSYVARDKFRIRSEDGEKKNGVEEERKQLLALAMERVLSVASQRCATWGMEAECLAAGSMEHLSDKRDLHTVLHI